MHLSAFQNVPPSSAHGIHFSPSGQFWAQTSQDPRAVSLQPRKEPPSVSAPLDEDPDVPVVVFPDVAPEAPDADEVLELEVVVAEAVAVVLDSLGSRHPGRRMEASAT